MALGSFFFSASRYFSACASLLSLAFLAAASFADSSLCWTISCLSRMDSSLLMSAVEKRFSPLRVWDSDQYWVKSRDQERV
jgi:hypothetical protein